MRLLALVLLFAAALVSAQADLTIVQKVEGAGADNEMTLKVKGDKMRIDINPQITTIIDAKTGEMINLLNDRKTVIRMSGEKVKAALEMVHQFNSKNGKTAGNEKPKLTPTGKKETVNGYETEVYTYEGPSFRATYWIALKYPDDMAILKQLQNINPDVWKASNTQMPDYRQFPGLPIKSVISISGKEFSTILFSVKQDPLGEAEFSVPAGYQEMELPNISGSQKTATPAAGVSPQP